MKKGGMRMHAKGWAITAGLGAAAGAVAVLMMPRNNPTRRLAAKAADKMEDVAMKLGDSISQKIDSMDM
jgi:gas vesicle protein